MQRSKHLALMFLLGAVLVGGALGFTADRVMTRDRVCSKNGDKYNRDGLADALGLSAAQRASLDTILDERHRQWNEALKPMRPRMDSIRMNARAQMKQMMTPEQRVQFEEILKEVDAKRKAERE